MTGTIEELHARRLWDSRGRPTVEVEVVTSGGTKARAIAPAGASRGSAEATDLRDGGSALGGMDVQCVLANVRDVISPALSGMPIDDQEAVDAVLDSLDDTPTRANLGGNATVATSLAVLHAAAAASAVPLWRHLAPQPTSLPRPEVQIIGGGAHAARRVDIQDFMVIPVAAAGIEEAFVHVAEVYASVGEMLRARGPIFGVADEGGHWPAVASTEEAIELLVRGIERAGLVPGADMAISLDIAASQFESGGRYHLATEAKTYALEEWVDVLGRWLDTYPIIAIEDPAGEHDTLGMVRATQRLGDRSLVVGDDYLVTNADRVASAAAEGACNAALIKVNQAGTVTRARQASEAARRAGWATIVSARSGETEDLSVAHLSVGWAADLVKVGSITRGERTAKWNELIRIDQELGGLPLASLPHRSATPVRDR